MDPSRWTEIEKLFHAALGQPVEARAAFLDGACAGDAELRRQVESLLARDQSADGLVDKPAWDGAESLLGHAAGEHLPPGTQLGPYRITGVLGRGGMGKVYEALDSRLDRPVAIKTSGARFSERFGREARAIAALNHPNICTLHDVGPDYLVMELVTGETLADRIRRGPVPLPQALEISRQIAEALEAAHERGIVHRDLKPGNVKIRPDGTVKVLDFGLAKVEGPARAGTDDDPRTATGLAMGTAGYMAPEQMRGEAVDKRADIWAFGVVLFEMITGKRPAGEPDLAAVPQSVRPLLRGCLEADPNRRLRSVADAMRLLLRQEEADGATPQPGKPAWLWPAAAAVAAALAVAFLHWGGPAPAPPASLSFQIVPAGIVRYTSLDLSPDGSKLAIGGVGQDTVNRFWIRDVGSQAMRAFPEAEGAGGPFWSPDGRSIAFAAGGKLKTLDLASGSTRNLCEWPGDARRPNGMKGFWGNDGVLVFAGPGGGLQRVSASGGVCGEVRKRGRYPSRLPDGRHFLYWLNTGKKETTGVYAGSLDGDTSGQSDRMVLASGMPARFVPSTRGSHAFSSNMGYLTYMLGSTTLVAQPFDPARMQVAGDPVPVSPGAVGLDISTSFASGGSMAFSLNRTGRYQVMWYDRAGKVTGALTDPGDWGDVNMSPDDRQVAIHNREGTDDLWLYDLIRGTRTRFTSGPDRDHQAVWSPDGLRIAWGIEGKTGSIHEKNVDGSGPERVLQEHASVPYDWSPDGRFLLYLANAYATNQVDGGPAAASRSGLTLLPLAPDGSAAGPPAPYLPGFHGRFSPNGRWVAYTVGEAPGAIPQDLYVSPFPAPPGGAGRIPIASGGYQPLWRRDGKELLYFTGEGKLMAVDVDTNSPSFRSGPPKALFDARLAGSAPGAPTHRWDMTRDGQRFLINTVLDAAASPPITVVMNWEANLRK